MVNMLFDNFHSRKREVSCYTQSRHCAPPFVVQVLWLNKLPTKRLHNVHSFLAIFYHLFRMRTYCFSVRRRPFPYRWPLDSFFSPLAPILYPPILSPRPIPIYRDSRAYIFCRLPAPVYYPLAR